MYLFMLYNIIIEVAAFVSFNSFLLIFVIKTVIISPDIYIIVGNMKIISQIRN